MIKSIRGILIEKHADELVVEACGIGYGLGVSYNTSYAMPNLGEECFLYTHLVVREDAMLLYGFAHVEERIIFERLIAVNGIGPKLALAVLSSFSPTDLSSVILNADEKRMSSVPGVGKKTAQRIILELKGVLEKDPSFSQMALQTQALPEESHMQLAAFQEAQEALLAMGFTEKEIELALAQCSADEAEVSKLVTFALKRLGGAHALGGR